VQIVTTKHFDRAYEKAPHEIQEAFIKQTGLFFDDLRHPSLHAKKYDKTRWQARATRNWRFYFRIEGDVCIVLDTIPHPK